MAISAWAAGREQWPNYLACQGPMACRIYVTILLFYICPNKCCLSKHRRPHINVCCSLLSNIVTSSHFYRLNPSMGQLSPLPCFGQTQPESTVLVWSSWPMQKWTPLWSLSGKKIWGIPPLTPIMIQVYKTLWWLTVLMSSQATFHYPLWRWPTYHWRWHCLHCTPLPFLFSMSKRQSVQIANHLTNLSFP